MHIDNALLFFAGSLWNNSSVIKGVRGCNITKADSKIYKNTFFVLFLIS